MDAQNMFWGQSFMGNPRCPKALLFDGQRERTTSRAGPPPASADPPFPAKLWPRGMPFGAPFQK
eukprot:gene18662-biopygen11478